jgi:hypothetical protein
MELHIIRPAKRPFDTLFRQTEANPLAFDMYIYLYIIFYMNKNVYLIFYMHYIYILDLLHA